MSLLSSGQVSRKDAPQAAAHALETLLVQKLLESSGAFHASDGAGASMRRDLFVEAMAEAVASSGALGIGRQLEQAFTAQAAGQSPAPQVNDAGHSPQPTAHSLSGLVVADSGARVTSGYGARLDPLTGAGEQHGGVDLAAPAGTPILAAASGVVKRAGARGGYGLALEIDHGGRVSTLYGHASALLVQEGDSVTQGQEIGKVGQTGHATGAHLHFEVRTDGRAVDPSAVLKAYGKRVEEANDREP